MQENLVDKWSPIGINSLEPNAEWVVRSKVNCSVMAGPGAGKTELLAQRVCYLLQTQKCPPPFRILAISFKKDAAQNLSERVKNRCKGEEFRRFDSFTFDALSKRLVDRFIDAIPDKWRPRDSYEIFSPNYRSYDVFLRDVALLQKNPSSKQKLLKLNSYYFERDYVLNKKLPLLEDEAWPRTAGYWAAQKWWKTCLRVGDSPQLTFPMIGRLAELLLRSNPLLGKSLRTTYTHVLMDEFQDTTAVQYDFVKTAFELSNTILTAVGDNKQHIMRWAYALDDAFGDFEKDFKAERKYLCSNYRSSPKLVELQQRVALIIDPNAQPVESKHLISDSSEDACIIWEFEDIESEVKKLAVYISEYIHEKDYKPRDFAVIVKQKSKGYVDELRDIFDQYDLSIRDESYFQGLLAEDLTKLLVMFIRFFSEKHSGIYWIQCLDLLERLRATDDEDDLAHKNLQRELGIFHASMYPRLLRSAATIDEVNELLSKIIEFLGEDNIKILYPEYLQENRFKGTVNKISEAIIEILNDYKGQANWSLVLDAFEGLDSIPIMTIHKSKGLEYKTVIFLGFDDDAWWSFSKQPEESKCAFFVALSRAKERVIFTYCQQRGERKKNSSLFDVLQQAGVKSLLHEASEG